MSWSGPRVGKEPEMENLKHSLWGRYQKKSGKCGNFSQVGDPLVGTPLPPVWEFFPDFTIYCWGVSHVKNSKNMEVGFG